MLSLIKLKYVGTGDFDLEIGVTLNSVYTVLAVVMDGGETRAVILDDNQALYVTRSITQPLIWELVSVAIADPVQLYP